MKNKTTINNYLLICWISVMAGSVIIAKNGANQAMSELGESHHLTSITDFLNGDLKIAMGMLVVAQVFSLIFMIRLFKRGIQEKAVGRDNYSS